MTEAEASGIKSFEELKDSFMAWAEQVANTRVHAETKTTPIARFLADGPPERPDPTVVREAFRWSVTRRVTKTATVSLFANRYGVEPFLVSQVICQAVPYSIGRHVHPAAPQARPPERQVEEGPGIDYLGLVRLAEEQAQDSGQIAYREVPLPGFAAESSESEAL